MKCALTPIAHQPRSPGGARASWRFRSSVQLFVQPSKRSGFGAAIRGDREWDVGPAGPHSHR